MPDKAAKCIFFVFRWKEQNRFIAAPVTHAHTQAHVNTLWHS